MLGFQLPGLLFSVPLVSVSGGSGFLDSRQTQRPKEQRTIILKVKRSIDNSSQPSTFPLLCLSFNLAFNL